MIKLECISSLNLSSIQQLPVFNRLYISLVLMLCLALITSIGFAAAPPSPYITYDAHPFEGCVYREWTARSRVKIYQDKSVKSPVLATLNSGDKIIAKTGELHVKPVKVLVIKDYSEAGITFHAGDEVYILASRGEGTYDIWKDSSISCLQLVGALINTQGAMLGDANPDRVLGKTLGAYSHIWWVKFQLPDGRTGWSNEGGSFRGTDLFGGPNS